MYVNYRHLGHLIETGNSRWIVVESASVHEKEPALAGQPTHIQKRTPNVTSTRRAVIR